MDLQQAVQLLTTAIANNTNDVQALQLALSILNNTYSADLTSLATSKAEADKATADLSAANATLATTQTSLDSANSSIADLTQKNTDLQTSLDTANAQVADLTTQLATANASITDLTNQVQALSTPVDPAIPVGPAQPDPAINTTP
jgi:chromosome segregation ATPase